MTATPPDFPDDLALALREEGARATTLTSNAWLAERQARVARHVADGVGPSVTGGFVPTVVVSALVGSVITLVILGAVSWSFGPKEPSPTPTTVIDAVPSAGTVDSGGDGAEASAAVVSAGADAGRAVADAGGAAPAPTPTPPAFKRRTRSSPPKTEPAAHQPPRAPAGSDSRGVGAQLRIYERAVAARTEGRFAVAERAYRSYLEQFPQGVLVDEARLGLAELLLDRDKAAEADALLRKVDRPGAPAPLRERAHKLRTLKTGQ